MKNAIYKKHLFLDEIHHYPNWAIEIFVLQRRSEEIRNQIARSDKQCNDPIKDVPNSFVVSGDLEVGHKNKIPLWLFGMMY